MKKFFFLFLTVSIPLFGVLHAQKTLDKGFIKMELTEVSATDPQVAASLEMMKGSQTEIYFTPEKSVSFMSMMGGMVEIKNYADHTSKTNDMLFNMMGNKTWVTMPIKDENNEDVKKMMESAQIEKLPDDVKTISGYKCSKVIVKLPEADLELIAYVTDEIKNSSNPVQGFEGFNFGGFPLEFTTKNNMFSMTMSTIEIIEEVDEKKLTMKTDGYQKMTLEEFQKTMGGMGFGF